MTDDNRKSSFPTGSARVGMFGTSRTRSPCEGQGLMARPERRGANEKEIMLSRVGVV